MTTTYIDSSLPSDEELTQLAAYVGGAMTEAETEAFDDRLMKDDEFFARMRPLLKVWYAPPPAVIEAGEALTSRVLVKAGQPQGQGMRIVAVASALAIPLAAAIVFVIRFMAPPAEVRSPVAAAPAHEDTARVAVAAPTHRPTTTTPGRRLVVPESTVVAELPTIALAEDSGPAMGALPAPYAARVGAHTTTGPTRIAMKQWGPEVGIAEAKQNLSFLQALGHNLGSLWGRLRHPQTRRLTVPPRIP